MKKLLFILLSIAVVLIAADKKDHQFVNKLDPNEDGYIVKFNRITLPVYEMGMLGNKITGNIRTVGKIDTNAFLYSAGFYVSGVKSDGEIWTNGVYPSQGISDYLPGTIESGSEVKSLFYVSRESQPFGEEWMEWIDAVELGAEFYDGDNDGVYNPVDKNNNGLWDPDEDRPAIYGDVMTWSIFNDGKEQIKSQGITIQQTVWSEKNRHGLDKVVFIKYSIENTGTVSQQLDSVIFSLALDPDLGFYGDDKYGCNININEAFAYYLWNDRNLLGNQISFDVTLIQGPIDYNVSDSKAYKLHGENFEVEEINSAYNKSISAVSGIVRFLFYDSPDVLRENMMGVSNPEPCEDRLSIVYNQSCDTINNRFQYSGNPIKKDGWVNMSKRDQKLFLTTGPFQLNTDTPQEIIFAFVAGVGNNGTEALIDAQKISKKLRFRYFTPPGNFPEPKPTAITYDNTIELVWETAEDVNFNPDGYGYNLSFEGYEVTMYNAPVTISEINSTENSKVIARYDITNNYNRILVEDDENFTSELIYEDGIQLHKYIYGNPETGRIILKINWDPFNNEPLRKGKPYYISITPFGFDQSTLVEFDSRGSYLIPSNNYVGYVRNEPIIINDNKGNIGIVIGENMNDSFFKGVPVEHVEGESEVEITYSIYDEEALTNDTYELSFNRMDSQIYELSFDILNLSTGEYLVQNKPFTDNLNSIQNMVDGFVINLDWEEPGKITYSFEGKDEWFKRFDDFKTGIFYLGKDIKNTQKVFPVSMRQSTAISVDKLKTVELRFGESSKAYRYVRKAVRYNWYGNENVDSGYVSIPVSAYKVNKYGNEQKLSIAFLENAFPSDTLGRPDGKWNPGIDVSESKEYLVVLSGEYSDDPFTHLAYTGTGNRSADIAHGYTDNSLPDSIKGIARSAWFDAMYVVGFETIDYQTEFTPTGTFTILPSKILTPQDKYIWKVKREKTYEEKKAQFDKINVYPNPLFGYNLYSNAFGYSDDEPFITFSNLPETADIRIYSLSGVLIRSLHKNDNSASYRWDLKNDYGGRIASGMYIAIIEVPEFGQKILKIALIQPQKRVHFK